MIQDAVISPCGLFRYKLTRDWGDEIAPGAGTCLVIGLNPSKADASVNDPTIIREIDFVRGWGFARLFKGNLFAFRATNPADMRAATDPVGPDNNWALLNMARQAQVIVVCWGANGKFMGRGPEVLRLLRPFAARIKCLGVTKNGEPAHPLYLRKDSWLRPFPSGGAHGLHAE